MKLEQQVTSLEISKRLKELGVKQESLFYYGNSMKEIIQPSPYGSGKENQYCDYSAFTVAELGQLLMKLPSRNKDGEIQNLEYSNSQCNDTDCDCGGTQNFTTSLVLASKQGERVNVEMDYPENNHIPSEANSRGKMLIYLLENKLINN